MADEKPTAPSGAAKQKMMGIVQDLMNLEITTIVSSAIRSRPIPGPRLALIWIARKYRSKLKQFCPPTADAPWTHRETGRPNSEGHLAPGESSPVELVDKPQGFTLADGTLEHWGSFLSFDVLREVAERQRLTLANRRLKPGQAAELMMLYRIRDVADEIKGVFKRRFHDYPPGSDTREDWDNNYTRGQLSARTHAGGPEARKYDFNLKVGEIVMIRKAWEMGTQEVAIKTTVGLDGDVVTQLRSEWASSEQLQAVHRLHNESVSVSLSVWSRLVEVVESLVKGAVDEFFKKG